MIDGSALIASLDGTESDLLADNMRSSVYHHGERTRAVTVLLHGLTASPRTWQRFAEERFARGENVLVPRLPRHGHRDLRTTALAKLEPADLRSAGHRIMAASLALGERVTLVGHSLGGSLALHLAHGDARVYRTIAIAPFLGISKLPHDWNRLLRTILAHAPNRFLYWDPIERGRESPQHGYARYSTRSIAAGLTVADALRADARTGPPASKRIEIVRNALETSVNNRTIDDLVERWRAVGGDDVRVHQLVGLGPSHDVIEPEKKDAPATRFLPHLHDLLDAGPAPNDLVIDARAARP